MMLIERFIERKRASYRYRHNECPTSCEDLTQVRLMTSVQEISLAEINRSQVEELVANCNEEQSQRS